MSKFTQGVLIGIGLGAVVAIFWYLAMIKDALVQILEVLR